jgi:hypothetical protein
MFHLEPVSTTNIISILQLCAVVAGFYFSWKALEATRTSIGVATQSLRVAGENLGLATKSLGFAGENLGLATKSLGLATQNAQVQLYNNLLSQGRELQLRYMDEFLKGEQVSEDKVNFFMGVVIAYYASCFELRTILTLPENAKKLLDSDVKESMRQEPFKKRFNELREFHSKEFGQFVDGLRGV